MNKKELSIHLNLFLMGVYMINLCYNASNYEKFMDAGDKSILKLSTGKLKLLIGKQIKHYFQFKQTITVKMVL